MRTHDEGAPAPSERLVARLGEDGASILLEWSPVEGATGYSLNKFRVNIPEGLCGAWLVMIDVPADTTCYRDEDVSEGIVYGYFVRALNENGKGEPSDRVEISLGGGTR